MNLPPHHQVYVRLKPSLIHGIGVFAIRDIPANTLIFPDDEDEINWYPIAEVSELNDDLQKMYNDFCIIQGNLYGCPSNFNKMTMAWYLNHSDHPNVLAREDGMFVSARLIKRGEELTADYSTYSEGGLT